MSEPGQPRARRPLRSCGAALLVGAGWCLLPSIAQAYTAAGDRLFPATVLLPQIGPSDELYLTYLTQPQAGGGRDSFFSTVYDKTIDERLSLTVTGQYGWSDGSRSEPGTEGFSNVDLAGQYMVVNDADTEFLGSIGVEQEFGGSGTRRVAPRQSSTTPAVFFGKGFGDASVQSLRPFAIQGVIGYQFADDIGRADEISVDFALEYSIPYLESKVETIALSDFVRGLTPIVEVAVAIPSGSYAMGEATAVTVAPGVNYAGTGWDVGLEALIPATRAAGSGLGVALQLHFSLDYLFPTSIGQPIF